MARICHLDLDLDLLGSFSMAPWIASVSDAVRSRPAAAGAAVRGGCHVSSLLNYRS